MKKLLCAVSLAALLFSTAQAAAGFVCSGKGALGGGAGRLRGTVGFPTRLYAASRWKLVI